LAWNITKKRNVNDYGFAHLALMLLLHYLVKCRSVWPFATISSYWVVHASAQLLFQDCFYCRRQTVD